MANQTDSETNGHTFEWKIENISHCWLKMGEEVNSPIFTVNGTKWSLRLYPMGYIDGKCVSLYLHRVKDSNKWDNHELNFQLGFLSKDGLFPKQKSKSMKSSDIWSCPVSEKRERVFIIEREDFLPEDTLTVKCMMWKKYAIPVKRKHFSGRTVFKVNRRSFVWGIDKFSSLESGTRNKFKDDLIDFDIVVNETIDFVKKLDIDIIAFVDNIKYFSFKTSIRDSEEKETSGYMYMTEFFATDIQKRKLSPLLFTKKLIENKTHFSQNDVLVLDCEYVSSNGTYLHEVCSCGTIYSKQTNFNADKRNENSSMKDKPSTTPDMAKDLSSLYNDGIFSDAELRTSKKSFPAHKNILSARSPVFRRMFIHDMKEKNSGHVDITDLEDDTVYRMLMYIYTDSLEDLQFENAYNLYIAGDKYEIFSLRNRCSSFLKDNLCPAKTCEVLVLADRHQDDDLKNAVQNYILKHDIEVFGSKEWKDFMDAYSKLAAEIMFRKVFPA